MGTTRVFFPQATLDAWLASGNAELASGKFTTRPTQRQYRVLEAVRVLREVTGAQDRFQLSGTVKPIAYVQELGAQLMGDSMVLEDNAYEVAMGWVALPDASVRTEVAAQAVTPSREPSDAEHLAQFLAKNL